MSKELVIFISVGILSCILLFGGAYVASSVACDQKSVGFKDHSFGVFSGCMVVHKGRWLPLQNIRGFSDEG
jgi:hypothetical protein